MSAFDTSGGATRRRHAPDVTIVIPVYNEEAILKSSIDELHRQLVDLGWAYELLIAENGSTDHTKQVVKELVGKYPQVRALHTGEPNYGLALRQGIEEARGTYVICDEIDICDTDFYQRALALLRSDTADLVIGSKRHAETRDRRPWIRRLATGGVTILFNLLLGFKGTDTHGLKAFHRGRLLPIAGQCLLNHDIFASEFVIRAQHADRRTAEIPIEIEEKRRPSIPLLYRVPRALQQIFKLVAVVRFGRQL